MQGRELLEGKSKTTNQMSIDKTVPDTDYIEDLYNDKDQRRATIGSLSSQTTTEVKKITKSRDSNI